MLTLPKAEAYGAWIRVFAKLRVLSASQEQDPANGPLTLSQINPSSKLQSYFPEIQTVEDEKTVVQNLKEEDEIPSE